MNIPMLTAALTAALFSAPAFAADLTAADVQAKLRAAGYTQVHELDREDGVWEADVTRADGTVDDVIVDPSNGEIFDARGGRPCSMPGRSWRWPARPVSGRSSRSNATAPPGRWTPAMPATSAWRCA